jgi:glutathione reductase (NADPH)
MNSERFDLFVVGGGSGGVRAARTAANLGARVGLCESSAMGGTCVNLGCVPKKLFAYAASYSDHFDDAVGFGWSTTDRAFNWRQLVDQKNREIARLNEIYHRLLATTGVTVIEGRGRIEGPHTVSVGSETFQADHILVATGSRPALPPLPGVELALTSDQLFHMPTLPNRMTIVGGGYIGVEFASIFHGLGVEVSLIHRGGRILKEFDTETVLHLQQELRKRGIPLHLNTPVSSIESSNGGLIVTAGQTVHQTDAVLMATGRVPNTSGLGLEDVGVLTSKRGAIGVNDQYQSNRPSIYAVGDVIDRVQLTPAALEEGMRLSQFLFGGGDVPNVTFDGPPTAVFTHPEFATVGLTEDQAEARGNIAVYTSSFRPMKHTLSGREERSFMKLIVDTESDRVLGAHMVGDPASEVIQGLAVAISAGATKAHFDQTLGIHPTGAEEFVTMRRVREK